MRKYNGKMKKTMIVIFVLFAIIIVIFSLFIKKSIDIDRTYYEVNDGNVLFDKEQNMINIAGSGGIKIKWGGEYYLAYNEKNYNLGEHVVLYDVNTGDINLYGKFYEVLISGEVDVIKGDNKIKSSVNSKFYKLADRKYLIIDRVIEDSSSEFTTSNYLIINLDKMGNATLLNDKTSYKTIKPTVLKTSTFTFDIANEILHYGEKDINLKKIIGSTNEYDEETYNLNYEKEDDGKEDEDGNIIDGEGEGDGTGTGTGTGSGSGDGDGDGDGSGDGSGGEGTGEGGTGLGGAGTGEGGTGEGGDGFGFGAGGSGSGGGGAGGSGTGTGEGGDGTGTGSGSGGGGAGGSGTGTGDGTGNGTNSDGTTSGSNSDYNNNYSPGVSDETVQEVINATKNTSVIRVTSGIDTIEIDYVVYDPNKEYKSVYVEVLNTYTSQTNTVYLAKTDTNMVIRDLNPNVFYNLTFKYTYNDDKGNLKEYQFDEVGLYTKIPTMYMSAVKILDNKLYYKITLDNNYTITGGTVNLYVNDQFAEVTASVGARGMVNQIYGDDCYLDLSSLNLAKGDILEMRIVTLGFNTYSISPGVGYKFRY